MPGFTHVKPTILNPRKKNSVFNPRYIDIDMDKPIGDDNSETVLPYSEVDEFSTGVRIYNFGNKFISIGLRDGSVAMLRPTATNILNGRKCYLAKSAYDHKGNRLGAVMSRIPVIKEGVYVCITKQVSVAAKTINKCGTTIATEDETGELYYGTGFNDVCREQIANNEILIGEEYRSGPELGADTAKFRQKVGPTMFSGEKPRKKTAVGNMTNITEHRYYETMKIEYFIPISKIDSSPYGCIYVEEVDMVFATGIPPHEVVHPYSERGHILAQYGKTMEDVHIDKSGHVTGFVAKQVVHNPDMLHGTNLYCNLNGNILEAAPVLDRKMEPGVYIYMPNRKHTEEDGTVRTDELTSIYLTVDDALAGKDTRVPLFFRTYGEAVTRGDELENERKEHEKKVLIAKQRLEELSIKAKELQAENAKQQQEYNERKVELEQRKAELAASKAERDDYYDKRSKERDDHYSERSTTRKDSSDLLKFAIGVGGVLLGIGVTLLK